ncbi:hypothetical protein [Winogradskyella tangerina]|uniref:hypothetical protein n=1 Tax=Winogradskyella tangerina TaxID=2023240 RepID=UPI000DBE73E9|nr:hypothetical protein [Winogradskyella tangerina]
MKSVNRFSKLELIKASLYVITISVMVFYLPSILQFVTEAYNDQVEFFTSTVENPSYYLTF